MSSSAEAAARSAQREREASSLGDFARLRELLLGDEQRELAAAHARIAALESAQQDLPQRLPAALEALRDEQATTRVAHALSAPVAQALGTAVRNNRQSLVDALFPVIGPLIRKSIAEALRNLVADLNGAIESSFTPRGIKWRIEAWRAGVPYAQVVLKHRLSYCIDHVFLIERETGLVIWHGSSPELPSLDADAIAGMLTALGDFVDDSVGEGSGGSLESARVGDHLVWVVQGPRANLSCFMRGVPPAELRTRMEQRLEEVHANLGEDGSDLRSAGAEPWPELLQPAGFLSAADRTPRGRRGISMWPWALLLLALLLAALAFFVSRERWGGRVEALRTQLMAQPGFMLGGIDSRPWRALTVRGLLDPDAGSLHKVLAAVDLGQVVPRLEVGGYVSTDDAIIAQRATRLLQPPTEVRLTVERGVLRLQGQAPAAWIGAAHERSGWIAGVQGSDIELTAQVDPLAEAKSELKRLAQQLASLQVPFAVAAQAGPGAPQVLDDIVRAVARARTLAATAHVELSLVSVGNNDEPGGERINTQVRELRAQWLAQALAARGIADVALADAGGDRAALRSAWLRLTIGESAP